MRKFILIMVALSILIGGNAIAAEYRRYLPIPLKSFTTTYGAVTWKTYPKFEYTETTPAIVWSKYNCNFAANTELRVGTAPTKNNLSPILVRFKVPSDYNKNGEWILTVNRDTNNVAVTDKTVFIGYKYYGTGEGERIVRDNITNDPVPVALVGADILDYVTLAPTSGSAVLTAKKEYTLEIWRDTANGTSIKDLRLQNVVFSYMPKY